MKQTYTVFSSVNSKVIINKIVKVSACSKKEAKKLATSKLIRELYELNSSFDTKVKILKIKDKKGN